jgi:tRNA G37 N-methylase Trm5
MIYLILFFLVLIIFIFSSKTFSPIPYFPSQPVDIPLIIKALKLEEGQTVIDLGAGDGIIIFEAAKKAFQKSLNTQFVAVEINPVLILILYLRRLFHPNKKNIRIVRDDIFKMHYKKQWKNITTYLYISPWFLEKTISNLKNQVMKFSIVSYMYPIKSLNKKEGFIQGKNRIFIYSSNS